MFSICVNSCEESNGITDIIDGNRIELFYSNEDSIEAIGFALVYSGELFASDSLIDELLYGLNYLRYVHRESIPIVDEVRMKPLWKIGEIVVGFDSVSAELVRNHQYTGWDSLEVHFHPDTVLRYPNSIGIALHGLNIRLHPKQLSEIYETLPGVQFSEPNYLIWLPHAIPFPIIPGILDGEFIYLFELPQHYYYFKYQDGEPVFVGSWNHWYDPQPDWWDEAISYLIDWN